MKTPLITIGIALSASGLALEAQAASFAGLNIYGDSLVDSGNLYNVTTALSTQGIPAIPPSPPYSRRASNGQLWIDQVAAALNLSPALVSELPLLPPGQLDAGSLSQGINYAFFGALSSAEHNLDDDIPPLSPFVLGFQEQIAASVALAEIAPVDPAALNIVWVGSNNYIDAYFKNIFLGQDFATEPSALPQQVTDDIAAGISTLAGLGAENFLVLNIPPLGDTPFARLLDQQAALLGNPAPSSQLNQLAEANNTLLQPALSRLEAASADLNITLFDVNQLFTQVTAQPAAFGLENVTDTCLLNFQPGSFQFDGICDNPDSFFFWDNVHTTEATYRILSDAVLMKLSAASDAADVPEPGAIAALLLVGSAGLRGWRAFTDRLR
ncbi:MAG: SGNH/GDSL hydrolase family protein [Leptolyngbya sp. SIO4C1]|nr:SGNH/GDSL hydrolase family protein [Leptolyngbya sp. SIO4C1]